MSYLNLILMQSAEGGQANPITTLIPFVLIFVVMYFFMIRPQAKRQKELKLFRESLQKGDKIITAGGIYGKIIGIKDTTCIIQVDENTNLTVDKSSVLKDPSDIQPQK